MSEAPDPFGDRDVIDDDPRGRHRAWIVVVACVVILSALVIWRTGRQNAFAPAPSQPTSTPSPVPSPSPSPTFGPRSTLTVSLPWLQTPADYDLFVHGDGVVFRIDPKTYDAVRVAVPDFGDDAPATLLPTGRGALVNPANDGTVYVVPDQGRVRTFQITGDGPLPGPDPDHIWIQRDPRHLLLIGLDGRRTHTTLQLPRSTVGLPVSDGHGYVIARTKDAIYDLRPGHTRRIGTGQVVAVGPNRILTGSCPRAGSCQAVVLDQDFKPIRTFPLDRQFLAPSEDGVISPNGRYAALAAPRQAFDNPISLLNLTTGKARVLIATVSWQIQVPENNQLAFSPDSRWLFFINSQDHLQAIDTLCLDNPTCIPFAWTVTQVGTVQQLAVRQ